MLRPTRQPPHLGMPVRIFHFGGETEDGTVLALHEGGRRLEVECPGGELLTFALNPASAQFVLVGGGHGARLELLGGL